MPETLLDLRGLRCPWPALRVARAIREAGAGAEILAVADDPIAPREIAAVATERGWSVTPETTQIGAGLRLSVTHSNLLFTRSGA
jgi:tRNA 2-thiouridine synthesizing protein A